MKKCAKRISSCHLLNKPCSMQAVVIRLFVIALKYPSAADAQDSAGAANTKDTPGAADTENAACTTNTKDTPGAADAQDTADAVEAQDAQCAANTFETGVGRSGPAQEFFRDCHLSLLSSDHCSLYPFRMLIVYYASIIEHGPRLPIAEKTLYHEAGFSLARKAPRDNC
jgi:hypothetical protein